MYLIWKLNAYPKCFYDILTYNIDNIVSISSFLCPKLKLSRFTSISTISCRICTQLQLSILDVDNDNIVSISICAELNLSIYNVDINDIELTSIFLCIQLKLSIFHVDIVEFVSISICFKAQLQLTIF